MNPRFKGTQTDPALVEYYSKFIYGSCVLEIIILH